jgi:beta-galactosidase/beta-glucuronidase
VDFDDAAWRTTDACGETWSTLGFHDYFGAMWYRTEVTLPAAAAPGKKTSLWISMTDSTAKVFVNGKPVRVTKTNGEGKLETQDRGNGYCIPFTADITDALNPSGRNQLAILSTRSKAEFNELGSGGLIGPVVVYRER